MTRIAIAISFLIIAIAVYFPTMNTPIFIGMDRSRITENEPFFEKGLKETFRNTYQEGKGETEAADRPLSIITYWLNYKLAGMEVFGFRIVNVILHAINGFLLYLLLSLVFCDKPKKFIALALIGALIYLLHPVHFVALYIVSQRALLMATMFGLLGLLCFINYSRNKKTSLIVWMYLFLLLSMFSKPNGIIFVFIIFFYTFYFLKTAVRSYLRILFPLLLLPLLVLWGHMANDIHPQMWYGTWGKYVINQLLATLLYLKNFFYPINLHFMYVFDPFVDMQQQTIIYCALMHFVIMLLGFNLIKQYRLIAFGLFATYIAFIPESSVFVLKASVAEYRTYIPYLFLSLAIVGVMSQFKNKKAAIGMGLIVCVILGVLTWQRNMSLATKAQWYRQVAINDLCEDINAYYVTIQSLLVEKDFEGALQSIDVMIDRHPLEPVPRKLREYLHHAFDTTPDYQAMDRLVSEIVGQMKPGLAMVSLSDVLLTAGGKTLSDHQMDMIRHKIVLSNVQFWMEASNKSFNYQYPKVLQRLKGFYELTPYRTPLEEEAYQSVLAMMAIWRVSTDLPYEERKAYVLKNHPEWERFFRDLNSE